MNEEEITELRQLVKSYDEGFISAVELRNKVVELAEKNLQRIA